MEYPHFDLDGQIALVTGASMGIGHDLALALVHAGATVVVASRNMEKLAELVQQIQAEGGQATAMELDMLSLSQIQQVVDSVVAQIWQCHAHAPLFYVSHFKCYWARSESSRPPK